MKIDKLFNPADAFVYLRDKVPSFCQEYNLDSLSASFIKKNLDPAKNYYHVIARYESEPLGEQAIFMTAHSQEDRAKAYSALLFLSEHGFARRDLFLPRPLFYDRELNAFFYLGIKGDNLLAAIKSTPDELDIWLPKVSRWAAELHNIPISSDNNFNAPNSRIATAIPGPDYFLNKIAQTFPDFLPEVKDIFSRLSGLEDKNLKNLERPYLIHGDLHPENVIVNRQSKSLTVIDYTDISLSDWARDIGTFIYQFDFMARGFLRSGEAGRLNNLFLQGYFAAAGRPEDENITRRLNLYKSWAALRATIYFLVKGFPEENNASQTLKDARYYLSLT